LTRPTGQRGQSLVEVLAAAPVVLLSGLIGLQLLAFGASSVGADNAAHAAALARQGGGDSRVVRDAARRAVHGLAIGRLRVVDRGGSVAVLLRPRAVLPGIGRALSVSASAAYVSGPR
jgi:hypothetical protein